MTDEIEGKGGAGAPYGAGGCGKGTWREDGAGGTGGPQKTIVYTPQRNFGEASANSFSINGAGGSGGITVFKSGFLEVARSRFIDAMKDAPIHPDDVVTVSWEGGEVKLTGLEALALIEGE
jgi:hypothetical protein